MSFDKYNKTNRNNNTQKPKIKQSDCEILQKVNCNVCIGPTIFCKIMRVKTLT